MNRSPTIIHSIFLMILALQMSITLVNSQAGPCDPNIAEMSCLLGCLYCFETFGAEVYDTAACCTDCVITQREIIDLGPSKCSEKYLRQSWLRRRGFLT